MKDVKMRRPLKITLQDVMHTWVSGTVAKRNHYESDPRVALLRILLHRSDLDVAEVNELFFAVYPHETRTFFESILEYELN